MREIKTALHSKKGFTLVELMIAIVIMGILVSVAIPVYSFATKNVKAKVCHSNCEIIEKAAIQYVANHDQERIDFVKQNQPLQITSQNEAEKKLPADFLACFKDGDFPECQDGGVYSIYYSEANDGLTVDVYCSLHGDTEGDMPKS